MMAAVKYLFMLTALCWYCCTLIEAGVIENCLSKCVAGVDAKDMQSSWAKIVCNARCGDLYPESGFQPSYTFQGNYVFRNIDSCLTIKCPTNCIVLTYVNIF